MTVLGFLLYLCQNDTYLTQNQHTDRSKLSHVLDNLSADMQVIIVDIDPNNIF